MRIVFDAYWWVSGPPSMRHVVRETVTEWARQFPGDELSIVVRTKELRTARSSTPSSVAVYGTRWWPQALLATVACRRIARRTGADVVYTQNFAASTRQVSAVFIHDVLFVTNPEWFSRIERAYFAFMPRLAHRADVVLTSSSTEAARIAGHSSAKRVVPVGIGLSTELAGSEDVDPVPGLATGQFLLTVGRLNVRKNLATAIAAALQSECVGTAKPLVVVGSANGRREPMPDSVATAVADGRVRFTGFVSEAQLRWLYANTCLFLLLSRGEGFGMPGIEALHFGAPMIVSDIDVFREIIPSEIPRVDPTDPTAIAEAIRQVLMERAADGESPMVAAPGYNWSTTVAAMRDELVRSLVNHRHDRAERRR